MQRVLLAMLLIFVLGNSALPVSAVARSPRQTQPQITPNTASYVMSVRLDPATKTVTGTEQITFTNASPDTLNELWLRLYLRAFRDANTIWMREAGYSSSGSLPASMVGDITVSQLTLAGGADLLASATLSDTLLRVPLPQPLPAGQSVVLDAGWTSKLPRVFARTGYGGRNNTFFMVGQWYPKMAVYDNGRWDTEPWHANAEFFNDFGSYDVNITVPQAYVVAGAGVPAGTSTNADGTQTLRFTSERVTDFAFAASPDFKSRLAKVGATDIALYYMPEHAAATDAYLKVAAESLQMFGSWYGAYPHPRLTIVDVPDDATAAGGMEYPTLVTSFAGQSGDAYGWLAYVTSHEIAHQWWPMQTATNEAAEPWLDEGLAEYTGIRYIFEAQHWWAPSAALAFEQSVYANKAAIPATLPSWQYTGGTYGTVYSKTALGLWTLESVVGAAQFRQAMASYLASYRFGHPHAQDFRAILEGELGEQGWLFDDYLSGSGVIDYAAGPIENSSAGSTVRIVRKGAVHVPVDILVTHANGAQQLQVWDGQAADLSLHFPAGQEVVRVEVDPGRKLKAELSRADNSWGKWRIQLPVLRR